MWHGLSEELQLTVLLIVAIFTWIAHIQYQPHKGKTPNHKADSVLESTWLMLINHHSHIFRPLLKKLACFEYDIV
jgi:hypothetical protein